MMARVLTKRDSAAAGIRRKLVFALASRPFPIEVGEVRADLLEIAVVRLLVVGEVLVDLRTFLCQSRQQAPSNAPVAERIKTQVKAQR